MGDFYNKYFAKNNLPKGKRIQKDWKISDIDVSEAYIDFKLS